MENNNSVYLEYMVKHEGTPADMIKRLAIIIGGLFLNLSAIIFLTTFFPIILAVSAWILFILWRKLSKEYEYIYTDGTLDVDCVYHRSTRKAMISLDCKEFALVAPASDPTAEKLMERRYDKTLDAGRGGIRENTYAAICNREGNTLLLLFEPTERMLEAMKRYNPRNVKYEPNK